MKVKLVISLLNFACFRQINVMEVESWRWMVKYPFEGDEVRKFDISTAEDLSKICRCT